jgi:hypothetical protein
VDKPPSRTSKAAQLSTQARPTRWAAWLLAALAGAAAADEGRSPWLPERAFIQIGISESARSTVAGATWAPFMESTLAGGQANIFLEASLGRWHGDADSARPGGQWFTQIGVTPVLRWHPGAGAWFIEGGIGVNFVAPRYRRSHKRFSTAFNFGDHLGTGWRFGQARQHEVALRVQHFSNGDIRLPNPGENFRQLRYTYAF